MTEEPGIKVDVGYNGNTLSVDITNEVRSSLEHVYKISKVNTKDEIVDFISLMGDKMNPTPIAIRKNYTYFLSNHCKNAENDRIEEGTLVNDTPNSLESSDVRVFRCCENVFF